MTTCYNRKYKYNIHIHLLHNTHKHTCTHTCMHAEHTHATGTHVACMHWYKQVNRKWGWGGGSGGGGVGVQFAVETKTFRSLVQGPRGTLWFWVEFWTGILLQHSMQSTGVHSMWQGPDGKKCIGFGANIPWCRHNSHDITPLDMMQFIWCSFVCCPLVLHSWYNTPWHDVPYVMPLSILSLDVKFSWSWCPLMY